MRYTNRRIVMPVIGTMKQWHLNLKKGGQPVSNNILLRHCSRTEVSEQSLQQPYGGLDTIPVVTHHIVPQVPLHAFPFLQYITPPGPTEMELYARPREIVLREERKWSEEKCPGEFYQGEISPRFIWLSSVWWWKAHRAQKPKHRNTFVVSGAALYAVITIADLQHATG